MKSKIIICLTEKSDKVFLGYNIDPDFQEVLNNMVAVDTLEKNRSLAGYQIKKSPDHGIIFEK